jgi:sterol desaturase/sphingolipid hydroxylase (fatty acid hydroxylase superfamily)
MSRTPANYWSEFILDIPLGFLLILEGSRHPGIPPSAKAFTLLIGLFVFTLVEYSFHRWLFHGSIRIMAEGHRAHHENPLGYIAMPFFLPALLLMGLLGISVLLMPEGYALLLAGAIILGYVTYGLSHFTIHHARFRRPLARRWAANHHIHHYHPDTNFGVTTPLWDVLLTTRYVRQ